MGTARGVLGYTHHQDSIYVALDAAVDTPEFRLVAATGHPDPGRPVLVDARWDISNLVIAPGETRFTARGFGEGEMRWRGLAPGRWRIETARGAEGLGVVEATVGPDGVLSATVPASAIEPLRVTIRPAGQG